MREDLQKLESLLEFRREGLLVVKVGLMTTMYFRGAHTPEMKAAVLRCLDFYFQLCRGYLKWAKHPSTFKFHTIESGRVPEPSKYLAQLKEGASWEFAFRGGAFQAMFLRAVGQDVARDPVHPGFEAVAALIRVPVANHAEEDFVDQILRDRLPAGEPKEESEKSPVAMFVNLRHTGKVAGGDRDHEIMIRILIDGGVGH